MNSMEIDHKSFLQLFSPSADSRRAVVSKSMCTSTSQLLRGLRFPRKSVRRLTDQLNKRSFKMETCSNFVDSLCIRNNFYLHPKGKPLQIASFFSLFKGRVAVENVFYRI